MNGIKRQIYQPARAAVHTTFSGKGNCNTILLIIKHNSHFLEDFCPLSPHFLEDFCPLSPHFLEDFCLFSPHFLEDFCLFLPHFLEDFLLYV